MATILPLLTRILETAVAWVAAFCSWYGVLYRSSNSYNRQQMGRVVGRLYMAVFTAVGCFFYDHPGAAVPMVAGFAFGALGLVWLWARRYEEDD